MFDRMKNLLRDYILLIEHFCKANKSRLKSEFIKYVQLWEISKVTIVSRTTIMQLCLSNYDV